MTHRSRTILLVLLEMLNISCQQNKEKMLKHQILTVLSLETRRTEGNVLQTIPQVLLKLVRLLTTDLPSFRTLYVEF